LLRCSRLSPSQHADTVSPLAYKKWRLQYARDRRLPSPEPICRVPPRHHRSPPHAVMYTLHLQHPAVTLQTSCLHGRVTKPSSPSLRLSPTPPLPTSSRSRFTYAVRASAAESPRPDPPQVTDQSDRAASTRPGPSSSPLLSCVSHKFRAEFAG
jgi:hypothetical protein